LWPRIVWLQSRFVLGVELASPSARGVRRARLLHRPGRQAGERPPAAGLRRLLLAGSVVVATLPVAIAAVRAIGRGWIPVWDRAYPALRAWDVFTVHSPLLGTRSGASIFGAEVNHPGPLEFQVLAPWVRVFGLSDGTVLGVAFLDIVCIVAVAWLAQRRGGLIASLLATAAMASLAWSLGSEMLHDPWPPHVVLFPFAVFVFAAWSTADMDFVALPVLVLSGSFVLQTHLGYAVLVPGVALFGIGALCWRLRRERRDAAATRPGGRRRRRLVLLALGTGLACWALPLFEQVSGRYRGNLGSLIGAATSPRPGSMPLDVAVEVVGGTLALPPWWLPPSFASPAVNVAGEGVSLRSAIVGLLLLASVLVVALVRSWRRERTAIATGLGLALVILPLAVYTTNNAPMPVAITVAYLRGLWVLSAFIGVMLALFVADEVRHRRPAPASGSVVAPAAIAAATLVVAVLALPYANRSGGPDEARGVAATRSLAAQVLPELKGRGTVLVDMSQQASGSSVGPGLLVELHDAGIPFVVNDESLIRQLGNYRAYDGTNADQHLVLVTGRFAREDLYIPRTARVVGRFGGLDPAERDEKERLRRELRDAIDAAGGFPIDADASVPYYEHVPWLKGEIDKTISGLVAMRDDPDELLDSDELLSLLLFQDIGVSAVEDVVDPDALPMDDLKRYVQLRRWETDLPFTVYLY
jgi:hypothetical protein